jgi:LPXTG-motif cell wall-anchored protein
MGLAHDVRGWLIMRMIAVVLLAVGVLALVYGGFSYTRQTHDARVGPLEISVSEKQRVNVPVWAGVVLVAAGAGLLLTRKNQKT